MSPRSDSYAGEIGNVAEAARVFGVARQTLHEWIDTAKRYGLSALVPKARRRPTQPNEMAVHEIEGILAEAIARPTLGAGRLLEHLAERDIHRSKSGVQKVLNRQGLGTRATRIAALAALTAATTGVIAREVEPYGFCHWAGAAGDLVGWSLHARDDVHRWRTGDRCAVRAVVAGRVTSTRDSSKSSNSSESNRTRPRKSRYPTGPKLRPAGDHWATRGWGRLRAHTGGGGHG